MIRASKNSSPQKRRNNRVGAIDLNRPGGSVNRPYLAQPCEVSLLGSEPLPYSLRNRGVVVFVSRAL